MILAMHVTCEAAGWTGDDDRIQFGMIGAGMEMIGAVLVVGVIYRYDCQRQHG